VEGSEKYDFTSVSASGLANVAFLFDVMRAKKSFDGGVAAVT